MPDKRKAYAPFSLITESGVTNAPVEGYIDVNQEIQPIINTGTVNENGVWTGIKSSDAEFIDIQTDIEIINDQTIISNNNISMAGFSHIQVGLFTTYAAGNGVRMECVHPADSYLNLTPSVGEGSRQSIASGPAATTTTFYSALDDSANALSANNWVVYTIYDRLKDLEFKFKFTNKTGDTIPKFMFGYRRMI